MSKIWQIRRTGTFEPIPGSLKTVEIELALEPVPGDVLILGLPDQNLDGLFQVESRVISRSDVTVVVRAYEES